MPILGCSPPLSACYNIRLQGYQLQELTALGTSGPWWDQLSLCLKLCFSATAKGKTTKGLPHSLAHWSLLIFGGKGGFPYGPD